MSTPTYSNGGRALQIAAVHVVALYEASTGRIAHVHSITMFEGGRRITESEAIETARTLARKAGHSVERLVVKVSKDAAHGLRPHRIDPKTGEFVALPPLKREKVVASGY